MKRSINFVVALMAAMVIGCSSENDEQRVVYEPAEVTLTFSPWVMEPDGNADAIGRKETKQTTTRAVASIAGVVSRLDVWIYESGSEVTAVHQVSTDDGFGTVTATLDKTKTYIIYAVGHNSDGAATLANGLVSFPSDIIRESMFYTAELSPASSSSLSCLMQRIVGKLRIETTDNVPTGASYVTLALATAATKWSVAGVPGEATGRTVKINGMGSMVGQTVALNCYLLSTMDAATEFDVVATVYDANDGVLMQRTFEDVPIRNGYKTTYRGAFFTGAMSASFTVDDWSEYDVVEF